MSRSSRTALLILAVASAAAWPAAAQAASPIGYSAGTYSGKVTQVKPRPYTGRISFVITRGGLSALRLSFTVACKGIGLVHEDAPIPDLTIGIGPTGGFSYLGTVDGTRLRIGGILKGHSAKGSFFQTLWFGHHFCTMNQPALYTAAG